MSTKDTRLAQETVIIRHLGHQDYLTTWQAMQSLTQQRTEHTPDELWLLEHAPVFTQGQNGKPEHLLHPGNIPIIQTDRGGQVTYHGPGQLVIYTLIDLKRKKLNIREMVSILERSVIQLLAENHIQAHAKKEAPGVYVADKKICSLGLRVRRGCAYHGLALNVQMDLDPFTRINPCGFQQLRMTQVADFLPSVNIKAIEKMLTDYLIINLSYNDSLVKH